jgi:hypothetical protein
LKPANSAVKTVCEAVAVALYENGIEVDKLIGFRFPANKRKLNALDELKMRGKISIFQSLKRASGLAGRN